MYTTKEIIKKAGIIMNDDDFADTEQSSSEKDTTAETKEDIAFKSVGELEEMLQKAIDNEEYELASKISNEINKRK